MAAAAGFHHNARSVLETAFTTLLWFARPEAVAQPGVHEACQAVLSPEERDLWRQFRQPGRRDEYLAAHALVRCALADLLGVDPAALDFRATKLGRPELALPRPPVHFSLTHTRGLVACAVSRFAEVGVDAEDLGSRAYRPRVASRFAPAEIRALSRCRAEARPARFLELWTLKEAYLKARGLGLGLSLSSFSFTMVRGGSARIAFAREVDARPASWNFARLRPTERHLIALAARSRRHPLEGTWAWARPDPNAAGGWALNCVAGAALQP